MSRTHRTSANDTPRVHKVEKIELTDNNIKARAIITIALVLLAAAAFGLGVWYFLKSDKGWQEIDLGVVNGYAHKDEYIFMYNLGQGERSATSENRALSKLYNEAMTRVYPLFDNYVLYDGVNNLRYINAHPNTEIEVDELLYNAFALLKEKGVRTMYLAPVYETCSDLFARRNDAEAELLDPFYNEDYAALYAQMAEYARDASAVDLQLLGGNKVKLFVSDEYLAYAKDTAIGSYIDLWFIQNAFIVDYCADTVTANGYTLGYLSSFDGYTRNFDGSGAEYSYEIREKIDGVLYTVDTLDYSKPAAFVDFRNYAISPFEDERRFYTYETGDVCSDWLDISDGFSRTALPDIVCYSYEKSCAEIAANAVTLYISDEFYKDAWDALSTSGIFYAYSLDRKISTNDTNTKY